MKQQPTATKICSEQQSYQVLQHLRKGELVLFTPKHSLKMFFHAMNVIALCDLFHINT